MTNDYHNINIHYRNNTEAPIQNGSVSYNNPYNQQYSGAHNNLSAETNVNHTRLNGLDSTILEEEAYRNLDDDILKTEYKMTKLANEQKAIEMEIEQARKINDYQKIDILTMRKRDIQNKLKQLHNNYKNSDVATHLSEDLANILIGKPNPFYSAANRCANFIQQNILRKIFKTVNSGENVKDALVKLETLNKNVDELVNMQTPYGESEQRYEMLTEYLNRANVIHYNISKAVGTPTFFDTISSIDKEKLKQAQKEKSNFGNMTKKKNI